MTVADDGKEGASEDFLGCNREEKSGSRDTGAATMADRLGIEKGVIMRWVVVVADGSSIVDVLG